MAAAQRRKKETRPQRRQKHYSRTSPAKQRRKPAKKRGTGLRKKHSPTPYDSKMLRQLQRDKKRLSSKAKGLMLSFMNNIYQKVSTEAELLRKQSRRPTIGPSQMQVALQQVMPRKRVRRSPTPVSRKCH